MANRAEYTLRLSYRAPGGARHTRTIPWNWEPTRDDVTNAVRRLRSQYKGVEVLGATLTREVLVQRYNIPNPEELT